MKGNYRERLRDGGRGCLGIGEEEKMSIGRRKEGVGNERWQGSKGLGKEKMTGREGRLKKEQVGVRDEHGNVE